MSNPWDKAFNTGFEWQDELFTEWNGMACSVTRALSPAGPDFVRVVFGDGSVFYFGFDAAEPIAVGGPYLHEVDQMPVAEASSAHQIFGPMVNALYDKASLKQTDTDL